MNINPDLTPSQPAPVEFREACEAVMCELKLNIIPMVAFADNGDPSSMDPGHGWARLELNSRGITKKGGSPEFPMTRENAELYLRQQFDAGLGDLLDHFFGTAKEIKSEIVPVYVQHGPKLWTPGSPSGS